MKIVKREVPMNETAVIKAMARQVEEELARNILPFWIKHTVDEANGGFLGFVSNDLRPDPGHDKASVLCARILWTFSAAYRAYGLAEYRAMADRACAYLVEHFVDRQHGGIFWMLDSFGNPRDTKKQVYSQAFAIYALSEYHMASGDRQSLDLAIGLYRVVEEHSRDRGLGGYVDALARNWTALEDMSLSAKDMNAEKTMNTHLHVLEAYTNLYRVWKDPALQESLAALLDVMAGRIVDQESHSFTLFFDMQWKPLSRTASFGHDIEGSWLLWEAAEVLGDRERMGNVREVSLAMARQVLARGVDSVHGGVFNEQEPGHPPDTDKVWWVQAEAAVGFMNAWQLTGEADFHQASLSAWEFIRQHIVDRVHGEWFWQTGREGAPDLGVTEKAGPWKCPYHNGRMCLQLLERIDRVLNTCDRSKDDGQESI